MAEPMAVDPQVHFGKPCVTGTRIPVVDVLELLHRGHTIQEITRDFHADSEDQRHDAFIVVEVGRHRFRHLAT